MLDLLELVVADKGYTDDMCIIPDTIDSSIEPELHSKLRARHEPANKRLKQFSVLTTLFRYDLASHATCFHAIARITQLQFKHEPLFEVKF